ncbi:MAG: DUF5618 family protein [Prevotellaceae bacterium]|jgi:uncharacterized protein (UPF0332 family)|nr:DUF5618 family protein [Prevotellaceae bacterium]
MSVQEQQQIKEKYYGEAIRYMNNAKECLTKAKKEGSYYQDQKYVRMACGTAYSGLLIALDCFLLLKGIHQPGGKERKSIEYYQENIAKIDKKILVTLNCAYQILHLSGYYDGIAKATVVRDGFSEASKIIERIKPIV